MASNDFEFHLEPFGQQPGLWDLYTQLTFCYPITCDTTRATIIDTLTTGLERLTTSFPWVAGQVVRQRRGEGQPEFYVIKNLGSIPKLVVKDLSQDLPTYDIYKHRQFPSTLLDEDVIAPRKTRPAPDDSEPKPVLVLQATFVTGGLLLTFVAQHGTLDMVGQGAMIKLLSKSCHHIPFTKDELETGNCDRRTIVPVLSDIDRLPAPDEKRDSPMPPSLQQPSMESKPASSPSNLSPQTRNIWAYFSFLSSALSALKDHAVASTTLTSKFISTDDALSAFIWQSISRARSVRTDPTNDSTFARTVDARRYLGIPPHYPGNLATKTFTTLNFSELCNQPVGYIASLLRQSIDPETSNIAHQVRAAATALTQPTRDTKPPKPARDLSRDIAFSSWAKLDYCHELDFNLGLGKPAAVRRPAFAPAHEQPMEGVVYLMPKRTDGEIAVAVCLREVDVERLKLDREWVGYATYIG